MKSESCGTLALADTSGYMVIPYMVILLTQFEKLARPDLTSWKLIPGLREAYQPVEKLVEQDFILLDCRSFQAG